MKLGAVDLGRCRGRREQPRQRQDGSALPDGPGLASETDRRTNAETSGGTPERGTSARTWWIWAGQRCAPRKGHVVAEGTSIGSRVGRVGGHDEMLRGSRGEAAGEELGADPVERSSGERGNHRGAVPLPDLPGRGGLGAPSADRRVVGRSRRSSPRPGKPVTWPRAAASSQCRHWKVRRPPVNTGAPTFDAATARARVLRIQTKLHQWAGSDRARRFDDLFNLVVDPAVLAVAWTRVRSNRGARTAGVDGITAYYIEDVRGVEVFLADLRADLKAREFAPVPVRERMIPKASGKLRRLGIPTVGDRVVQAALKLVLEPIFEADFQPCSYGFRPGRRAQDAIAEVRHFATRSYEWVLEGDIEACFDRIDHAALLDRVRRRIEDKRVLALIKAFLKAGIMTEHGGFQDTVTGTPQGGILSPLLANIALSALDEHFAQAWTAMGSEWQRRQRRTRGEATFRLVRYADDFVVVVSGQRTHAQALHAQTAAVLAPLGLTLSPEKTRITHIDEGIEFLGWRVQRHRASTGRSSVYTYASKPSLAAVKAKVKAITRSGPQQSLDQLLHRLNPVLRGRCAYFRGGVSGRTFSYLRAYTWRRVLCWLRRKHPKATWRWIRRRYLPRWWPTDGETVLYDPSAVRIEYYRYRGAKIATPWAQGRFQRDPAQMLERLQTLIAQ